MKCTDQSCSTKQKTKKQYSQCYHPKKLSHCSVITSEKSRQVLQNNEVPAFFYFILGNVLF